MKKLCALFSAVVLSMTIMVGCAFKSDTDELVVYFVPSKNPKEIQTATELLADMLKSELAKEGFKFNNIRIEVGTSFNEVGEALTQGTAHVGFIPGGTYLC